jgi:hypothetical protein
VLLFTLFIYNSVFSVVQFRERGWIYKTSKRSLFWISFSKTATRLGVLIQTVKALAKTITRLWTPHLMSSWTKRALDSIQRGKLSWTHLTTLRILVPKTMGWCSLTLPAWVETDNWTRRNEIEPKLFKLKVRLVESTCINVEAALTSKNCTHTTHRKLRMEPKPHKP